MSSNFCTTCNLPQPRAHMMYHGEKVAVCRTCRLRAVARAKAKLRRSKTTLHARFERLSLRLQGEFDAALCATRTKRLKTRFNHETAVTRTRLRIMRSVEDKSPRTLKAIAVRQKILDRYTRAFEAQLVMVRAGVNPPDIVELVEA